MKLPAHWRETEPRSNRPGTWRFELRSPVRFTSLRTVALAKIRGVKLVAGQLRDKDPELTHHRPGAMVPQALVFSKQDWPDFRRALQWQSDHFTRLENPPPRRAKNPHAIALKVGAQVVRALAKRRGKNPPPQDRIHRMNEGVVRMIHDAATRWLSAFSAYGKAREGSAEQRRLAIDLEGKQQRLHSVALGLPDEGAAVERIPNPPRRLEDFKRGTTAAIDRLVRTEIEISSLTTRAIALMDRGDQVPQQIQDDIRRLQLERLKQLEDVRTAIQRHGAAIGEFHVTPPRRANPAGGAAAKKEAERLYRQFHGTEPRGHQFQEIPDLTSLVHLGACLRVDYKAARARGSRNTPYMHDFDPGAELFTDATGRALVILGNIKVSRAPRGRFGYIRAAGG